MKRNFVCLALALVMAPIAGWQAALAHWRGDPGSVAPQLFRGDPQISLRRSDPLLAHPEQLRAQAPAIKAAAAAILRDTPLSAPAMRQLGLILKQGGGDAGLPSIALAERISRRDLPTELVLIDAAARRDDVAITISHYDHALSVYPDARAQLFPLLASELDDPDVRRALVAHAAKPWMHKFAADAVLFDATPAGLMALYADLAGKMPAREIQDGAMAVVVWLISSAQYGAVREFAAQVPGLPRQSLEELGFTTATTDARFRQLSWSLSNDGGIEAGAEGNRLTIRIEPENTAVAAIRTTFLTPGSYAVSQTVDYEANVPHAQLAWKVICRGGTNPPLLQLALPSAQASTALSARFSVPTACPAQEWELQAGAGQSQFASSARLSGLSLQRH